MHRERLPHRVRQQYRTTAHHRIAGIARRAAQGLVGVAQRAVTGDAAQGAIEARDAMAKSQLEAMVPLKSARVRPKSKRKT